MRTLTFLPLLISLLFLQACTAVSTQTRPDHYYNSPQSLVPQQQEEQDLFSKENKMSDADIARILGYRLKLPNQVRIAILKLSDDNYWRYYSSDFFQIADSISLNFVKAIKSSDKVYDASILPSMLVPEKRTVPYLREAAARYQADLLLVYRNRCSNYQKYRFLSANETKAYCSVETALIDVRKGIVPFTSLASNDYKAVKTETDTNFQETIKKAEFKAIGRCLDEIAKELVTFLNKT